MASLIAARNCRGRSTSVLQKNHRRHHQLALLVSDRWQKQGLGKELLRRLVQIGRDEKLERITAVILADNHAMQNVSREAGFVVEYDAEAHDFNAGYNLKPGIQG